MKQDWRVMLGVACYRMRRSGSLSWGWRDALTLCGRVSTTHQSVRGESQNGGTLSVTLLLSLTLLSSSVNVSPLYFAFNFSYSFVPVSFFCGRILEVEVNKAPVEQFTGSTAPRRRGSLQTHCRVYCDLAPRI